MDFREYRVGRFTLQANRQLLEAGVPVPLGRKGLHLMSVLALAEGNLVTKEELMAAVWPNTVVEENALQVQIAAVRKLLGTDADLLVTVHGLGYRLAAVPAPSSPAVAPEAGARNESALPSAPEPGRKRWYDPGGIAASTIAWHRGEPTARRIVPGGMALASLLFVLIALAFYVYARGQAQHVPKPAHVAGAARPGLAVAFPTATNARSIAVLPFDNYSGDPKEEYFSDGMTEEITSALAKIPHLAVVGRTSAFQFKGKAADLRAIGKTLNAAYLLEGSVRKAHARVRVTAELIRADTGDHLWTDSYDRDLKDVFAVQEDIARAIATAMQVPLGLKEGENLVSNRTSDTAAYEDYLRAISLAYNNGDTQQSIALLESVVARDPGYAPAWAFLATVYPDADDLKKQTTKSTSPLDELRANYQSALTKTNTAAENALRLDPSSALAYAALGNLENLRGHWAAADDDFARALALDPTDPLILDHYGALLEAEGRLRQALKVHTRMQQDEPLVSNYKYTAGETMLLSGDADGAVAMLEQVPAAFGGQIRDFRSLLGFAYASTGQYQRAAQTIRSIVPNQLVYRAADIGAAADIIGTAPAKSASDSLSKLSPLVWVYLFVGEPERFMDALEYQATAVNIAFPWIQEIWHPAMAGARKTERFKQLVRKFDLVDYWRARGWPDMCHPVGADDFECS